MWRFTGIAIIDDQIISEEAVVKKIVTLFSFVLCFGTLASSLAQITLGDTLIARKFLWRAHTGGGVTLPYRLFVPSGYSSSERYPLIVVLHGGGERGTDDSIHILTHPSATVWARDSVQAIQKSIVISPQCPLNKTWCGFQSVAPVKTTYSIVDSPENSQMKCVMSLIDSMKREFSIDSTRVYVCGMSLGGFGSFDAIMRHPTVFAAAAAMCGGGDTTQVANLKDVSLWMCHSNNDSTVYPVCSRLMVSAFQKINRKVVFTNLLPGQQTGPNLTHPQMDSLLLTTPTLLYSEYSQGSHQGGWRAWWPTWTSPAQYPNFDRGFDDAYLIRWMLAQKKPLATSANRFFEARGSTLVAPTGFRKVCFPAGGRIVLPNGIKASDVSLFSLSGRNLGTLESLKTGSRNSADAAQSGVFIIAYRR